MKVGNSLTNLLRAVSQGHDGMLRIQILNKRERRNYEHCAGPLEIGRGPERDGIARCTVQDNYVSKDHVRLMELSDGRLRIENLSLRNSIRLADNSIIGIGEVRELRPPIRLTVGETLIDIDQIQDSVGEGPLATITSPFARSGSFQRSISSTAVVPPEPPSSLLSLGTAPSPERLMEWFETLIAVQKAASGSQEFYQETAQAVVRLVGLDRGLVILRAPKPTGSQGTNLTNSLRWKVQARYPEDASGIMGREFSQTILERVLKDRCTYFQSAPTPNSTESLQGVEAVVVSPIFDPKDDVVGFVYGSRSRFTSHRNMGIGPLEAHVVQLLASTVAVGLERQQQEAEIARGRVQFEQFFSAQLAQELQRDPGLLTGQEREITVLFSDIRGFSRLAERLGPQATCELVADVMDRLTRCIIDQDGVVVDYAGDGILAMWNAPKDQPDHAVRAARAGLAMLASLPQINADWHERLGGTLLLGIGINTGRAMCGNTGSRLRFKYGPLGHTVNLASRVESATKQMNVPLLITGSTRAQLGDQFATRRLCKVRVVGIQGAVDFYELYAEQAAPEWLERRRIFEEALALYESGQWGLACSTLYPLLSAHDGTNYDVPCLNLITRAVEALKNPPTQFDGIVELSRK